MCRPKERETRTRRLHKWIFEVKIEGSASFRLKHDRLRHRSIAARLKYPLLLLLLLLLLLCVTRRCIRRRHSRAAFPLSSSLIPLLPLFYATTLCFTPLQLSIFLTKRFRNGERSNFDELLIRLVSEIDNSLFK